MQHVSTGMRRIVALPGGSELVSNPPQYPINWSPDGKRLAYAHAGAVQVVDVATLTTTSIGAQTDATATRGTFAPVVTARGDLAVMTGCCVAPMTIDTVDAASGAHTTSFAIPAPVGSISRDHRDSDVLWLTLQEAGLFRWDGERLAAVSTPGSLPLLVSG